MFRFKVVDSDEKVLAIKSKLWEAEKVYRDNYKRGPKIIALKDDRAGQDFEAFGGDTAQGN